MNDQTKDKGNLSCLYNESMEKNIEGIYGKYLFKPDLILISIWALLALKYCTVFSYCIPAICLLRIILAFQMRYNSSLTAYSSVAFIFCYFFNMVTPGFEYISKVTGYYLLHLIGKGETAAVISSYVPENFEPYILTIQLFWIFWNAIIPLIFSIIQIKDFQRQERRKTLKRCLLLTLLEIILFNILCGARSPLKFPELESVIVILLSILPFTKYIISNRKNGNVINSYILSDRNFKFYIYFLSLFLFAFITGLYNINFLQDSGLLILPVFFYIMLCKAYRIKIISVLNCILMSVGGALFNCAMNHPKKETIIILACAIGLIVLAGIRMVIPYKINKRNLKASFLLIVITLFVLIPLLLGLNPYIAVASVQTYPYRWNLFAPNGLFITENGIFYGLRDRYGEILETKYSHIQNLDKNGNYIAVLQWLDETGEKTVYSIYDLNARKFIYNETGVFGLTFIEPINESEFILSSRYKKHFATLKLPGMHEDGYVEAPLIEPIFEETDTRYEEFIMMGEDENIFELQSNKWDKLKKLNKPAYTLMLRMNNMAVIDNSPKNDLKYSDAVKYYINEDSYYKGNLPIALSEITEASEFLASGNPGDVFDSEKIINLITKIKLSEEYKTLFDSSIHYYGEYEAWHNLNEALNDLRNYNYTLKYSEEDRDELIEETMALESRLDKLKIEKDIILGNAPHFRENKSLKNIEKITALFNSCNYDKLDEIKPAIKIIKKAFDKWYSIRQDLTFSLPEDISASYQITTDLLINDIYSLLQNLLEIRN